MTSPFNTVNNDTNDDVVRNEETTVTLIRAAPVNNINSHRVIIDLSQDDSDNDDDRVYMEVVEILDVPVPLEPSTIMHPLNDVNLYAPQISDHSRNIQQHHDSPLPDNGNINRYHYHHRDHPGDGRLLNIDNASYQGSVPIFGNGSENSGISFTCIISQLGLITVTKDDIIQSETPPANNNSCHHEQAEFNRDKYCCSICFGRYQIGEQKILLPCCHQFHDKCVYQWLSKNGSCPICKLRLDSVVGCN